MAVLHRPSRGGEGSATPQESAKGCKFSETYPGIWEFVAMAEWEPGVARTPGTLLLCWSEGRFRLWFNDKDSGRAAWVSAETATEALRAAEKRLVGDSMEWRADKGPKTTRR